MTHTSLTFEKASDKDLHFICDIYNYYVLNTEATFHTQKITTDEMRKALPWNHKIYETFIINVNGNPVGYCYLGNYKPRQAYDKTTEVTLYLDPESKGKGIGNLTLEFLENKACEKGFKNLIGIITATNQASVNLFEKQGYVKAGHLKNIGEKFGKTLDVLFYQKVI